MKKLLVVLAALALLAGSARAANNGQDMGAYKINASTKQIVDGSGNAAHNSASTGSWGRFFQDMLSTKAARKRPWTTTARPLEEKC